MDLTVGKLDDDLADMLSEACATLSVSYSDEWQRTSENIETIFLLNLASVGLFDDHVKQLQGFSESRFRNLPWWMMSIWLPVDFDPPLELVIHDDWMPIFLGSCQRLQTELDEVRRLSPHGLGNTPPGYEAMRSDVKAFYRTRLELSDSSSIIRGVWRGLHDAAEIAIRERSPICGSS